MIYRLGVDGRVTKLDDSIPTEDIPVPLPYVYQYSIPGSILYNLSTFMPKYCRSTAGRSIFSNVCAFIGLSSDSFIPLEELKREQSKTSITDMH